MPRQQHLTSEKHENRQGSLRGEEEQTEQTQAKLPPWKLPLFKDPHLARSVNAEQRAVLLQAGQQVLGNRVVQRLLHPEATQDKPFSEQVTPPVQGQVEEEEEAFQAVEAAPTPNAQGFMMGQEALFGPGPHTWGTVASIGQDFTYAYAGEKDLSGVGTQMNATTSGGDFTLVDGGKKALKDCQAEYRIKTDEKASIVRKEKQWFVVLEKFRAEATYWLNSGAQWDPIRYFPGGDDWRAGAGFNTPEGSKIHEEAELKAIKPLWENAEKNIRKALAKGFKTRAAAVRYWKEVAKKEFAEYTTKRLDIRYHRNPVGPEAEWDYYKKEFAKYKEERAQRQELLKSFPRVNDLATSLEDFQNAFIRADYEGRMSAANAATAKAKALGDKERQLIMEDVRESGVFERGTWYSKVHSALLMINRELGVLLEPGMGYGAPSGYMNSLLQLQTELGGLEVAPRYVWGMRGS